MNAYAKFTAVVIVACLAAISVIACEQRAQPILEHHEH